LKFLKDESAATAIEYALIAAGMSLAFVTAVSGLGRTSTTRIRAAYVRVAAQATPRVINPRVAIGPLAIKKARTKDACCAVTPWQAMRPSCDPSLWD